MMKRWRTVWFYGFPFLVCYAIAPDYYSGIGMIGIYTAFLVLLFIFAGKTDNWSFSFTKATDYFFAVDLIKRRPQSVLLAAIFCTTGFLLYGSSIAFLANTAIAFVLGIVQWALWVIIFDVSLSSRDGKGDESNAI